MKRFKLPKLALATTVFTACLSLVFGQVSAIGEGQIEGGDIYRVRNVTKGSGFANAAAADACDTVQFRLRLHNPGPGEVSNLNVTATLPGGAATTHTSTATVSGQNMQPATTSDTATVNVSTAQRISYVAGSTQLLDTNSNVIRGLPDGITGGINIGNVGVSLNEIRYVQFNAKLDCPPPPQPEKSFKCEGLDVTQVSRTRYNFNARASAQNVTIQNYVFTVKNSAGQTVDTRTVTTGVTTANYEFNQSATGTYTITAVVTTDAGATDPSVCAKQVTVVEEGKPTPPPASPSKPVTPAGSGPSVVSGGSGGVSVLPAAGPEGIAAIVGIVSVLSAVAHSFLRRPDQL